jgi:nicotinamide-nucleotide amidase
MDAMPTMPSALNAKDLDYVRIDDELINQAIAVLDALKRQGLKAVSAESCTGGLIAAVLTEAPGAAEHFDGGFVVYTPEQKFFALKIAPFLIEQHGTVSREVAEAMAEGALLTSNADIAVSVTGVAGPDTDEKGTPVGRVYFGCARRGAATFNKKCDFGERPRSAVRHAAAMEALIMLTSCLAAHEGEIKEAVGEAPVDED